MHSDSDVRFDLNGQYDRFVSDIGIDDEVGNLGRVRFRVLVDGQELYNSGNMWGFSSTQTVDVDVTGANELQLIVDSVGSKNYDHADWAGARLVKNTGGPFILPGFETTSPSIELWQSVQAASNGASLLNLDSSSKVFDVVYQDVTTVPGQAYQLRFDLLDQAGTSLPQSNEVEVFWDGQSVGTFSAGSETAWQTKAIDLPAPVGVQTRLEFREIAEDLPGNTGGGNDGNGPLIDNIRLFAVETDCNFHISENAPIGTPVGTVLVDTTGSVNFSISGGNVAGNFAIDPATGEVTVVGTLDFETQAQYNLIVSVTDGVSTSTVPFDVTVLDGNDSPVALDDFFADAEADLTAFYPLDEFAGQTAEDLVGSNPGSLSNTEDNDWVTGVQGNALNFSYFNENVIIPSSPALDSLGAADSDFTISFCLRLPNDNSNSWRTVLLKGDAAQQSLVLEMRPQQRRLRYSIATTSGTETASSNTTLSRNNWHHVALVKSGNAFELYLNGNLDTSLALAAGTVGDQLPLYLGANPDNFGVRATFDELRIYDRALSFG